MADLRKIDPRKLTITYTLAGLLLDRLRAEVARRTADLDAGKKAAIDHAADVQRGLIGAEVACYVTPDELEQRRLELETLTADVEALADALTTAQLEAAKPPRPLPGGVRCRCGEDGVKCAVHDPIDYGKL